MWGFHCPKCCVLLESREGVRKRLQLQQAQWDGERESCTLLHSGSNYPSMTGANKGWNSIRTNRINIKLYTVSTR